MKNITLKKLTKGGLKELDAALEESAQFHNEEADAWSRLRERIKETGSVPE